MAHLTSTNRLPPPSSDTMTFAASRSRKAQWDILQSYIDKLTPDISHPTQSILIENIHQSVLLALLAKKRSELDLLLAEAALPYPSTHHHSKRSPGLQFPDYEFGFRPSARTDPTQKSPPMTIAIPSSNRCLPRLSTPSTDPLRRPHRNTISELVSAQRSPHSRSGSGTGVAREPKVSPLSPTFGPRRGEVPSGTMERRRASLPSNCYNPSTCATPKNLADGGERNKEDAHKHDHMDIGVGQGSVEKRILWDAAWRQIEGNFEEYVGRFDGDVDGGKQLVWDQILALVKQIHEIRSSSRSS